MLTLLLLLFSENCLARMSYPLHPEFTESQKSQSAEKAKAPRIVMKKERQVFTPDFHILGHDKLLKFAESARRMPLPDHEYSQTNSAQLIHEKYASALLTKNYLPHRSHYKAKLLDITSFAFPQIIIPFEQLEKRIDALFSILNHAYAVGAANLWELSLEQKKEDIGRDLLFAGLAASRGGWENLSSELYKEAANSNLNKRYFPLLWSELDNYQREYNVAFVIKSILTSKQNIFPLLGDQANFQVASELLNRGEQPQKWVEMMKSPILKARLHLAYAIFQIENNRLPEAKDALLLLERNSDKSIQKEAHLALARLYMSQSQPNDAIEEYQKLSAEDANRLDLLEEKAFAEYKIGRYQASLGKSIGMESDYFRYAFAPEAYMLEILSRKALCDFGGAKLGLQKLAETYGPEQIALAEWVANNENPEKKYERLIRIRESKSPKRFERYLLAQRSIVSLQSNINARSKEWKELHSLSTKKYIQPIPGNWLKFLAGYQAKVDTAEHHDMLEIVNIANSEAKSLSKKLEHFFAQADLMKLDIATQASEQYNLQSALNFPARKIASAPPPPEKLAWAFQNEIWEDELDYLVAKNPSRCVDVKSLVKD